MMKKIAFYVEGQTELLFLNKLLIEIAGRMNVFIELQQFTGKEKKPKIVYPKTRKKSETPTHYILIKDCMGDKNVKPRIIEEASNLFLNNYVKVIGLIDLYPSVSIDSITKYEDRLSNGEMRNGKMVVPPLPKNTHIIVVVREIEDWFLAECNHYHCIDNSVDIEKIFSIVGFNPCLGNLINRSTSAAQDLHDIYQLLNKKYMDSKGNKPFTNVENVVECIDYANLYLNVRYKIPKLNDLMTEIEAFLV